MPYNGEWDFHRGIEQFTRKKWIVKNCVANKGRNGLYNSMRYIKYFVYPCMIFLNRNKFNSILAWQAFYGLLFAFYCRVFRVEKTNFLLIKNFIYKPKGKKSLISKFYFNWMKYIVKSNYVDVCIVSSKSYKDYCRKIFKVDKFHYIPFGVEDFNKDFKNEIINEEDFVLSLGRSNRDWKWLIDAFEELPYKLKIICDNLHVKNLPSNVELLDNLHGTETHRFIKRCKVMIIPILDGSVVSGETVLLKTMCFSKPIIITQPSCLADDYVRNYSTGIIISKNQKELKESINRLFTDKSLFRTLSVNARNEYELNYSIFKFAKEIAKYLK